MELVNGLQKAKKLVKRLKDSDLLSPDPLALEWVIELFETIEQIDTPELVEGQDMAFTFTDDGEKIKA